MTNKLSPSLLCLEAAAIRGHLLSSYAYFREMADNIVIVFFFSFFVILLALRLFTWSLVVFGLVFVLFDDS